MTEQAADSRLVHYAYPEPLNHRPGRAPQGGTKASTSGGGAFSAGLVHLPCSGHAAEHAIGRLSRRNRPEPLPLPGSAARADARRARRTRPGAVAVGVGRSVHRRRWAARHRFRRASRDGERPGDGGVQRRPRALRRDDRREDRAGPGPRPRPRGRHARRGVRHVLRRPWADPGRTGPHRGPVRRLAAPDEQRRLDRRGRQPGLAPPPRTALHRRRTAARGPTPRDGGTSCIPATRNYGRSASPPPGRPSPSRQAATSRSGRADPRSPPRPYPQVWLVQSGAEGAGLRRRWRGAGPPWTGSQACRP